MRRNLKKAWVFCAVLAIALLAGHLASQQALAQESMTLPTVEIDLWPEYDQPAVLVIYHLTLPAGASLPASVSLRLPKEAGSPHAVAARQPDGSLVNLTYDVLPQQGDWSLLTFNATTLEVQVEYYDYGLAKNGDRHSFSYTWPGDYAIDQLTVQVQQPLGASQMEISPDLGAGRQAADNLVYFTSDVGSVPGGQPVEIKVEYIKAGDELSVDTLPVQSSDPIVSPVGAGWINQAAPWLIGGLGLLLLGGGGYWYWRTGQQRHVPAVRTRRHRPSTGRQTTAAGSEAQPSGAGGSVYCHQCGKRANPGDRFCRTCGTALKV